MEDQADYITTEPRFTCTEVLDALRQVIAEKNLRHGLEEHMFYHDRLALQMTTDAMRNLINKHKTA